MSEVDDVNSLIKKFTNLLLAKKDAEENDNIVFVSGVMENEIKS